MDYDYLNYNKQSDGAQTSSDLFLVQLKSMITIGFHKFFSNIVSFFTKKIYLCPVTVMTIKNLTNMKKLIYLFIMFVFPLQLSAKTVEIDGINYYLAPNSHMAEVIPGNYSGLTSITIPEAITYDDVMYNVTTIGGTAFSGCSGLSSITIPNSVTII